MNFVSAGRYVIYSPGAVALADAHGAWWLLEAIASHLVHSADALAPAEGLVFWSLIMAPEDATEGPMATLVAQRDSGEPALVGQDIPFTDYPRNAPGRIWAGHDGTRWTIYLPEEH